MLICLAHGSPLFCQTPLLWNGGAHIRRWADRVLVLFTAAVNVSRGMEGVSVCPVCALAFGPPGIPPVASAASQRQGRDYKYPNPLPLICWWEALTQDLESGEQNLWCFGQAGSCHRCVHGGAIPRSFLPNSWWPPAQCSGPRTSMLSPVTVSGGSSVLNFPALPTVLPTWVPIPGTQSRFSLHREPWLIQYAFQKSITLCEAAALWHVFFPPLFLTES